MGFPGNFNYNNFLKQYQKLVQQTAFPANTGPTGAPTSPTSPFMGPGSGMNTINSDLLFQQMMQLQTMLSPRETSTLLKAILELPEDIQSLLAQLSTQTGKPNKAQQQALKQLLEDNPDLKISLDTLQEVLGKKTQESANKMLKLMQSNMTQAYTGDSQKLTELLKFSTQLSLRANASPMEALNTLMLLYIPWYPLTDPQKLEIHFEDEWGEAEEGEEGESYTLVIYLETDTMGKFRIAAGLSNKTQLIFKIEHEAAAKPYIESVEQFLVENLTKDGIPPPVFSFTESKASQAASITDPSVMEEQSGVDDFETFKEDRKKVSVYPSKGISVIVLNAACHLSRIIFEVDERNRLLQRREMASDD